jgi:hypothetical protein
MIFSGVISGIFTVGEESSDQVGCEYSSHCAGAIFGFTPS